MLRAALRECMQRLPAVIEAALNEARQILGVPSPLPVMMEHELPTMFTTLLGDGATAVTAGAELMAKKSKRTGCLTTASA